MIEQLKSAEDNIIAAEKFFQDKAKKISQILYVVLNHRLSSGQNVQFRHCGRKLSGVLAPYGKQENIVHHINVGCKKIDCFVSIRSKSGKTYPVNIKNILSLEVSK